MTLACLAIAAKFLKARQGHERGRMMSWLAAPASDTQITHGRRLWLYIVCGLVMFFLAVPSLVVVPMSF